MPCCGLHELRERVPIRYTIAGSIIFWGALLSFLIFSVVNIGRPVSQHIWRVIAQFFRSLWHEAMRDSSSIPSRWSCRLSSYVFKVSPRAAEKIAMLPEIAFIYAPIALLIVVLGLIHWSVASVDIASVWQQ